MKHPLIQAVIQEIEREILGKSREIEFVLIAFFSQGHVLIEDLPGMGKTSLAKAISNAFQLDFQRVQGSTDLLPSDIIGVSIFNPKTQEFSFQEGPVFTEILLFDEMNRTPPKTQSALLQVMAEQLVTVDQQTYELKDPFFVIGTQNPSSSEGTYKLPESQLDRFSMRLSLGYPQRDFEKNILLKKENQGVCSSFSRDEILSLQKQAQEVHLDEKLIDYILSLVELTRSDPRLIHGISVRGSQELVRLAKTRAYFEGRDFIIPEDIKSLAPYVWSHRIQSLDLPDRVSQEEYILSVMNQISIPI